MSAFYQYFVLSAPLFAIVLIGYLLAQWPRWRVAWTQWATKFVFFFAIPAMLFHLMSDLSSLPPINAILLVAFFGGCLVVFVIGRLVAAKYFHLDGVAQSVFALGGIFSNNVLLGLPLAKMTLGAAAVPSVALVVVFNAMTLWTLVSISIEWARHGSLTVTGFGKMAWGVVTSPLVAAILVGVLFGLSGLKLPVIVDRALSGVGAIAGPGALLVLGMGLTQYGIRSGWQQSAAICALKLVVFPLTVWLLATLLGLPPLETKVIVLLASMSVGTNVYLMSMQFQTMQGAVASSLVLSTALAAFTTPLFLAAMAAVL
ncbi:MAG: AEC family transporter [Candidatus Obscuribacterales bacterium]|nr:AEC family transporter [Steroidobacteraceae bacterium]